MSQLVKIAAFGNTVVIRNEWLLCTSRCIFPSIQNLEIEHVKIDVTKFLSVAAGGRVAAGLYTYTIPP
jgi:hypothetical protein